MPRILNPLALPLLAVLAACGGGQPQTPATSQPAAEAPAVPAAAPTVAADTAPLFGRWAVDPAGCANAIVITATNFEGEENVCEINSLTDNGDGSFLASMSCVSAGETNERQFSMTPLFGPQGEGIRFSYPDAEGTTVFRCPEARTE